MPRKGADPGVEAQALPHGLVALKREDEDHPGPVTRGELSGLRRKCRGQNLAVVAVELDRRDPFRPLFSRAWPDRDNGASPGREPLAIGGKLFDEIKKANADYVVTSCGSCKMQISHAASAKVVHPIELLAEYCL